MPSRPAGLIDADPWAAATPKLGLTRLEGRLNPDGAEPAPCRGCPHLFMRYAAGGPGRPGCAQGVEYGQPGCRRATGRSHA